MQNELSSRIDKIWAMAEIALAQGSIDYGVDGHSKVARLCGMTFRFADDFLVRVRGRHLDAAITHRHFQNGVVFFPGAETSLHFLIGDDAALSRAYLEFTSMRDMFSSKAA